MRMIHSLSASIWAPPYIMPRRQWFIIRSHTFHITLCGRKSIIHSPLRCITNQRLSIIMGSKAIIILAGIMAMDITTVTIMAAGVGAAGIIDKRLNML
jgi:hypothetical protein